MIKLEEYLEDNQIKLHKYKVKNLKNNYLNLSLKETNIIFLEYIEEIKGNVENSSLNIKELPNGENNVLLEYVEDFTFITNEEIFQPLDENEIDFYLFSFKDPNNIDVKKDNFYFIQANSNVTYDLSEYENQYLFEINFSNIKQLKNFDSNNVIFKFRNNEDYTRKIELKVPNSVIFSDLAFIGTKTKSNGEKINNFLANVTLENDIKFFPHLIHPVAIQSDYVYWYDSFNNYLVSLFNLYGNTLSLNDLKRIIIDKLKISFDEAKKIVESFFKVLQDSQHVLNVLMSNFAVFNNDEQKIKKFKADYYNGNNPKEYIDWKLKEFFDEIDTYNDSRLKKIFETLILMMSNLLLSSFCFKGGFTHEHELFLPLYISSFNKSTQNFTLDSHYFSYLNQKWIPKFFINNHNVFDFRTKPITLPLFPEKIEELDITNSPIDFNTSNSLNFNYLGFAPSKKQNLTDYINKTILKKSSTGIIKRTITWDIDDPDGVERTYTNVRGVTEEPNVSNLKILINKYYDCSVYRNREDFYKLKVQEEANKFVDGINSKIIVDSIPDNVSGYFYDGEIVRTYSSGSRGRTKHTVVKFRKVHFEVEISIEIINNDLEIYQPQFLYKNENEYLETFNNLEEELNITFTFPTNFQLEKIIIKSIFAKNIKIKLNDENWNNYKLAYSNNKLNTTTKIIL
ncbi:hypothetical protein [Mycoplasmopsis lipofaciens]|uniref:hypothetical protein n=1 Tax=Mycoplasmopsis lipofaciens TaxID=114884 RepID=UPI000B271D06|nr:hypothetical protein [Mycoplasmopsis lipofaciens]